MPSQQTFQLFADAVLLLHAGIALFVVAGLPLIAIGHWRHWRWVNALGFRLTHLAAVLVVAAQSWFGAACPLTTLENWLRQQAHGPAYEGSFVEHWLQHLLFYQAPPWLFVAIYTLFGLLVVLFWLRFPPRRDPSPKR